VANHDSPYRLSLVTGDSAHTSTDVQAADDGQFQDLVVSDNPEVLHAEWLTSGVASAFAESVFYPYTSLRFHVLLTAALLDAYRDGYEFNELFLAVSSPSADTDAGACRDAGAAVGSDVVVPHRTVLWTPVVAVHVTPDPAGRPAARLGGGPARSFADVWSRLPACPFDVDVERRWRVLDAQLRRVRSWSTALQYIEEYVAAFAPSPGDAGSEFGGDGV
jgi:hypothetical protein